MHKVQHEIHRFDLLQVPVQLPLICALSSIKISFPSDLRPVEARQSILLAVQELETRFPQGLPKLHPVKVASSFKSLDIKNWRLEYLDKWT